MWDVRDTHSLHSVLIAKQPHRTPSALLRGQELQDSSSTTVAVSSAQEESHNPAKYDGSYSKEPMLCGTTSHAALNKSIFLLSCQNNVQILMASIKNFSWKELKPTLCIEMPNTYEVGPFSSVPYCTYLAQIALIYSTTPKKCCFTATHTWK